MASLSGSGSSSATTYPLWGAARVTGPSRMGVIRRLRPVVDERSGGGVLRLRHRLTGSGIAWNDDELALEWLLLEAA